MANKIINTTMLAYYDSEKKKVNATKTELKEVSDKVDEIIADGGEPNKIDTIKVNGTAQTITNKAIDLTVPTKVSEITNDSGYQTEDEVQTLIDSALTSALDYKGTVATASALPSAGNKKGDVYNVSEDGMNYAWDGSAWDALGGTIDLSSYWDKTDYTIATASDIDAILNV